MNTDFISNEPLMIKNRLQEAYRKITFIADNEFMQDSSYKEANQALWSRIKKVERTYDAPRAVRDVIPNSNLAKYGHYHYNEARERSYTTSPQTIPLHYPCLCKADDEWEPWMLPEVEQIFIHTVYTSSYNFRMYETELELLEKGEQEEAVLPSCCIRDLNKVNPIFDRMFEPTPGKAYGPSRSEGEFDTDVPYYFNVKERDCLLLRKRILSDVVREIWNRPNLGDQEKLVKIYKSTLDNFFVEEDNFKYVHSLKAVDTERSLQALVDSIVFINAKVPKAEEVEVVNKEPEVKQEIPAPPARRLYSDVVQGNKSPTKQQQQQQQVQPQQQNIESKSPSPTKPSASIEEENSARVSLENLEASPCMSPQEPPLILEYECADDLKNSSEFVSPEESKIKYSYSDALNNAPNNLNQMLLNDFAMYEANNFRSTTSVPNSYNPMQYVSNPVYNANYRLGYVGGNFTNQLSTSRHNFAASCQQQWLLPTVRSPGICNYGNFVGHILLPQMPTKHRWNPSPPYARPATPQNGYQPMTQNWGVYRSSSSTQQFQGFDAQKVKNCAKTAPKFVRSQTPDSSIPKAKHCFAKKNSSPKMQSKTPDYKLMTRQDPCTSFNAFEVEPIPISCSASDELEKIALREYQSSNDMFFTEIERQAQEQYDGNPENLWCPPNKQRLSIGGQATFYYYACIFQMYISFNTSNFSSFLN